MYMRSKTEEDRAYYDWMGFVGNLIGVGALLLLPFMGYLLAYELCDYDASICPYMMADQLMEVQWHPTIIGYLIPQRGHFHGLKNTHTFLSHYWGIHKGGWAVNDKQRGGPHDIQEHAKGNMPGFHWALHGIPRIKIGIQNDRFQDEQQWIDHGEH